MKRFATLFGMALVASTLAGCDGGGISEGTGDQTAAPTGQTDSFRETMEKQSAKMKMQRPAKPPGAGTKAKSAEVPAPTEEAAKAK